MYNLKRDHLDTRDYRIRFIEPITYSIYDPPMVYIKPSTWWDIIKAKWKKIWKK